MLQEADAAQGNRGIVIRGITLDGQRSRQTALLRRYRRSQAVDISTVSAA
jgi:hypothetical protein